MLTIEIPSDKYGQISRILLPLCTTISLIPDLVNKPALRKYIEAEFGDVDSLIREILGDFFRHGKLRRPPVLLFED